MTSAASGLRTGFWTKAAVVCVALLMSIGSLQPILAQVDPVSSPAVATPESESLLVADFNIDVDFPRGLTVGGTLQWDGQGQVERVEMLYATPGSLVSTIAYSSERALTGPFSTRIEGTIDLQQHYLPVGITLNLWWRILDANGIMLAESSATEIVWQDDSWNWQTLETDQVALHYYDLSGEFADTVLATLQATIDELEASYTLVMAEPIQVWIYANYSDFQTARPVNSRESVAALAFPAYHVIAAILADGDDNELLRVLPHEISHQVLYQATDNPYTSLPVWFDEGLATHVQTGGTDGYLDMVTTAYEQGELFRLESLNFAFPNGAAEATLAYATSWSAITFIEETWGSDGIADLVSAFASGLPYDQAIPTALGISADQLNDDWTNWVASHG